MKRICLVALALLLASPALLLAKPVEVLVFPSGAIVTEQSSVTVADGIATLSLPAVADTASLKMAVVDSDAAVSGLQFDSVREEGGDYQSLKEKIEATKIKLQDVEDQRSARARALDLCKSPLGEKFATAEEYRKLVDLVLAKSETLGQEHSRLEREKKEIDKQLKELERQLAEATNRQKRSWAVQVALSGAKAKETLRYSYRVRGADWRPTYTLDARPEEQAIRWDWTADVTQQTAIDWKNVQLLLATAEPVFTLTPPENQPWIIREAQVYYTEVREKVLMRAAPMAAMAPMEPEMDMLEARSAPVRKAGTLFDVYDLGQQTIVAGESYQLNIRKGSWPATFDYLLRPLQSPQAFLLAKVEFDELLPMPSGNAAILVEGVFVGQRGFSLLEKKLDLAFGNDPQLMVKVNATREAGEAGVFGGDKTQAWNWKVDITNNKNVAVKLRVEDSLPQIEDQRIKLVETVTDHVDKDEHLAKWEIELKPGEKKSVTFGHKIRFPEEMTLELGR